MIFAAAQFQQFIDFPDSQPDSDKFSSPCKTKYRLKNTVKTVNLCNTASACEPAIILAWVFNSYALLP